MHKKITMRLIPALIAVTFSGGAFAAAFQLTGLSADIDFQVFNQFGNLIGSGTNGGSTSEDFTLNGLLSGVYYIRILPFNNAVSNYSLSVTGV